VQVPIPPLDEQCRIASILDKADAVRQKRQATIDLADQLTQAVYLEMFGDPVTNPMGWPLSRLDQLTTHITDGKHGDCRPCPGSGHYFISVKDIVNGRIMYENAREIEPADFWDVHKRTRFDVGDLLITNSGTIGKTAVATEHPLTSRTTFQKSVAVVKPIPSSVAVQFLKTYIDLTVKELSGISSGSAQKNLLLGQLRELPIVFPPIALQREYSRRLLQINRLKQSHLDALVTIDALVSSLQNAMFSAEADIGRQFLEARVKATPSGV
jgi:type I restriction enzyme S subunit